MPSLPPVTLRFATKEDCPGILACHTAALRELCRGVYADTRLEEWTATLTQDIYLPAIRTDIFLVAEIEGRIAGFAEFDPSDGQIAAVYIDPPHFRKGLGTALYRRVEEEARKADIAFLTLLSSLPAVPFYERFGFTAGTPTTMPLDGGIEIPCIPMSRMLESI